MNKEKECKHKNVISYGNTCPICGAEEGYCADCDREMIQRGSNGEWEEA